MDEDFPNGGQPPGEAGSNAGFSPGEHFLPVSIPDHQLLRCIGRGSYGEVWLARNMMGVFRAVKIVHRKTFKEQRPFERELSGIRKYEPISRSYDGFIDVLHIGINEEQGYFYYVMEVGDDQVAGQVIDPEKYSPKTLGREISQRGKLSLQECLQLGLALSQALAELHKHGLVHRDIKPSNIIFVNGVPKLADIGLVADISEARSYVGTEGFIPPEGPGAPQADIYSLGKVLYESSTGKDRTDFPELPTLLDEFMDNDAFLELNEVVLNACKNDLGRRYQTAWDMHADLVVVANGKSVKRLKLLERRLSRVKRMAGISAIVLAVAAGIGFQLYRERRNVVEARHRQVVENVTYGIRAEDTADYFGALPYFAEAVRLEKGDAIQERNQRLRFGSALSQCPKLEQIWFRGKQINSVQFSPDGTQVLIVEENGVAQILDAASGEAVSPPFAQSKGLWRGAFDPSGTRVVTINMEDSTARIWGTANGMELLAISSASTPYSVNFSSHGERLIVGYGNGVAQVYNATNRDPQLTLAKHVGIVTYCVFSPDDRLIVTCGRDGTARLWNANDGSAVGKPIEHSTGVSCAAFSGDGSNLLTACFDYKVRVWDLTTPAPRRIPPDLAHLGGIYALGFSPDRRFILTSSGDSKARIWSVQDHHLVGPVMRHSGRIVSSDYNSDGGRIVSGCSDGTVRIWNLAGVTVAPPPVHYSFSGDGNRFLTATNGLRVWDSVSRSPVSPPLTGISNQAQLSQNGKFLVTLSQPVNRSEVGDKRLQVLEAASGRPAGPDILVSSNFTRWTLSLDGSQLVVFGKDSAQPWDVPRGRPHSTSIGGFKTPSVVLSPDAREFAVWDKAAVKAYRTESGVEVFEKPTPVMSFDYVEFSPDNLRLAGCGWGSGFEKCWAEIWDATTGKPIGHPLLHGDGVHSSVFSADGGRIVTAGEEFQARIWDVATSRPLGPALKHERQVPWAAFNSDDAWIVTASYDKTARVWDGETGEPVTLALRHPVALEHARFLADNQHIISDDGKSNHWIWKLPIEERPAEELGRLAYLLSATSSDLTEAGSLETLRQTWNDLRAKYPATFRTSTEEAIAWHRLQLEQCQANRDAFGAAFHLKRLLLLQPDDEGLLTSLKETERQLQADSVR